MAYNWQLLGFCPLIGDYFKEAVTPRGRVRAAAHARHGWSSYGVPTEHDYYSSSANQHEWWLTHLTRRVVITHPLFGETWDETQTANRLTGAVTGSDPPTWQDDSGNPFAFDEYTLSDDGSIAYFTKTTGLGLWTFTVTLTNHYTDAQLAADVDTLWAASGWGTISIGTMKQWGFDGSGSPAVALSQNLTEWDSPGVSDWWLLYTSHAEIGPYSAHRAEHRSVAIIKFCVRENETGDLPGSYPSQAYSYRSLFDLPVENDTACNLFATTIADKDGTDDGTALTCVPAEVTINSPDWVTSPPYVRTRIPVYGGTCPT